MADIRSSQVLAQIEWQEPGKIKASQIIAQVEWVEQVDVNITADPIIVTTSVLGSMATGVYVSADPITITTTPLGGWVGGGVWSDVPIDVAVTPLGGWITGLVLGEPIEIILIQRGLLSQWPARERDPALDQEFDCYAQDRFGNWGQGIPVFTVNLTGTWLNQTVFADPITITTTPLGDWITATFITADPITVTIGFKSADVLTELLKTNWLKWSNIGNLDFTIDKTNVAGEKPLDWKGWIYAIRKLGSKVVAYGENGVSVLTPAGNTYGLQTIYRIGLKGKGAVSGDDSVHYFVDNLGQLWRFSEGLEKLDYSEYLFGMIDNLVLSWDVANKLLYICDGSQGYVFSQDSGSLGAGPVNVTGIDSQSGTLYVASPGTIETPTFKICTDIYDLGTRKGKNIYSLEIGTDLTETMEAAIDYRLDKAAAFATTDWHVVDPRGLVYIPVHGREFRFRFKSDVYSYFEVEPIIVNGEVCSH